MQLTPFNDVRLRDWAAESAGLPNGFPAEVGTMGSGPFEEADLGELLERLGAAPAIPSANHGVVVVGRTQWSEEDLSELVTNRAGESLRVYSQEMLLAWIVCGADPFDESADFLLHIAAEHPALDFLRNLGFEWPTTEVFGGGRTRPDGEWPSVGLLGHMGYRVGRTAGRPERERRLLLRTVFKSKSLPRVNDAAYMREWGAARSRARLLKLANTLASLCQNEKRRRSPPRVAIEQRESDLAWAKREFYDGRFDFEWPTTDVW